MPSPGDSASSIASVLKMIQENIERGYSSPLPEPMNGQMEKMLKLDPQKDGEKIKEIYDDFFDEFIARDIEFPI